MHLDNFPTYINLLILFQKGALLIERINYFNVCLLNVVLRWPGSKHDQTVIHNYVAHFQFERCDFDFDCGYANTSYLRTSIARNNNVPSEDAARAYQQSIK